MIQNSRELPALENWVCIRTMWYLARPNCQWIFWRLTGWGKHFIRQTHLIKHQWTSSYSPTWRARSANPASIIPIILFGQFIIFWTVLIVPC
jgi:hypothetical protein